MDSNPVFGVIGGSGVYQIPSLENIHELKISTPYGDPSSPIILGELSGKKVAFLARHGIGHIYLPSEVNYRANIYALKSIGVTQIISISACGSLREDFSPGNIVIPDQIVDLTHKRVRTFFGEGIVAHVGVAEPFCYRLSNQLMTALEKTDATVHKGGTYITIEGPRFSTKGESNLFREWGMSIIGMTASPEVFLAKEAEICYTTMAHVTDYDVWHTSEQPVTVEMVIEVLRNNTLIANQAVENLALQISGDFDCMCQHTLKNAIMTDQSKIPEETRNKLDLLVKKYLK